MPPYRNLEFVTQVVLFSAVVVLLASAFIRAGAVVYRKMLRIPLRYPRSWTPDQCRLMDQFRLYVGLILSAFWIAQYFAAPLMPTNWPFGFLESVSVVLMLILTNAWIVLLLPRDWGQYGALTSQFAVTITVLILWWALMFGGTALMLARATISPLPTLIGGPVLASCPYGFTSV